MSSTEKRGRSCGCADPTMLHVLVTGAGGELGRTVARELVRRGAVVHATDVQSVSLDGVTTWKIPSANDPHYLPAVTRLVADLGISLVIPTTLAELPVLATGRATFSSGVDVVVAGAGPVATSRDRLLTAHHLASRRVAVPPFSVPSAFKGTAEALQAMGGPLAIRPRTSETARAAFRVTSPTDVDWATLTDDLIVQRHLNGVEYVPMAYRPGGRKGVSRQVVVLRSPDPVLPNGRAPAGVHVQRSGVEDIERLTMAAVRALGLSGPVDLVVRREEGRPPVVFDVTARLGRHFASTPQILDSILAAHRLFIDGAASASNSDR